jgi:hypothetical protein
MRKNIYFGSILLLFIALSCSSVRVSVNYNETANFREYRSFYFVKPDPSQAGPGRRIPFVFSKGILDEIKSTLETKGFAEADGKERADLLVVFYTQIHDRKNVVAPAYRVGRWGGVWQTRPGHVVHYKEGTLVIDIVDRERRELVWQGIGNGVLDRADPSNNLAEAASEILKAFPPEI